MEYKWDRIQVENLILLVQENPCLYNVRSKEYMDRIKKAMAFNEIASKLEMHMAGLSVEDVKKKWKSLRSQYLREIRFVKNSKKSGSGINDVYEPKLWCFDQLNFLETHTMTRKSQDNTDKENMRLNLTPETSMSTENICSMNEEPKRKQPKKNNQFVEMRRDFSGMKELILSKTVRKYSWLGTMVAAQMDEIDPEQQQNAAWEVQTIIQEYIAMSRKPSTRSPSYSNDEGTQDFVEEFLDETPSSKPYDEGLKDLVQLSMDGVFEDSDIEN